MKVSGCKPEPAMRPEIRQYPQRSCGFVRVPQFLLPHTPRASPICQVRADHQGLIAVLGLCVGLESSNHVPVCLSVRESIVPDSAVSSLLLRGCCESSEPLEESRDLCFRHDIWAIEVPPPISLTPCITSGANELARNAAALLAVW